MEENNKKESRLEKLLDKLYMTKSVIRIPIVGVATLAYITLINPTVTGLDSFEYLPTYPVIGYCIADTIGAYAYFGYLLKKYQKKIKITFPTIRLPYTGWRRKEPIPEFESSGWGEGKWVSEPNPDNPFIMEYKKVK